MNAHAHRRWSALDVPSQKGRRALVTGTGGLGLETALVLAGAGAEVLVAGRNAAKGHAALDAVRARHPDAQVRFEALDLADLSSVRALAERLQSLDRLDLLVNNAGVMALPKRQTTRDGFEMQLGTNYLGHFALTGLLLPLLRRSPQARVVSVSSMAARGGAIHFDDLQLERRYTPWKAYGQSKLALLMFALELQRRSERHGWGLVSCGAHPGFARTELIANGPGAGGLFGALNRWLGYPLLSQSAAQGALPVLFAATAPEARGGGYYGPDGFSELKGAPAPARIVAQARDEEAAARLWQASSALTRVSFE